MKEEIPIECYVTREGNLVKFVRYEKILELQTRIDKAIEYIEEHRQTYDIDGSKEPKLDDFDILASPKVLLNILRGDKE